jgi:hypothetical protein
MLSGDLISSIGAMRPAVFAKIFRESALLRDYQIRSHGTRADPDRDEGRRAFVPAPGILGSPVRQQLRDYVWVENLDAWWAHIEALEQ